MIVKIHQCLSIKIDNEEAYYLRFKDLAFAEKMDEKSVKIKYGKYKDTIINLLDSDYKIFSNSLICKATNYDFEETELEKLENLFKLLIEGNEFLKIGINDNEISVEPILEEKMLKIIKNNFSLNDKKNEIIHSMFQNGNTSITLTEEQRKILLSEKDSENIIQTEISSDSQKIPCTLNQIYNTSKKIIIGQDEPLKMLLSNVMFNMNISSLFHDLDEIADVKKTILLCGSTGTGKTLMIKTIANKLGIPYTIEDASRYTAVGYYGASTDDLLINLVSTIPKTKSKKEAILEAQNGIIFIDEIDKICHLKDDKSHIGTTDVQESLLKMIEGTIIRAKIRDGFTEEKFEFDTRKLTFVLSGAFQDIVNDEETQDEEKLVQYGMIRELIGRISSIIKLKTPTKEDLKYAILNSERSYLKELIKYFNSIGIESYYTDEYVDYIAECAFNLNDGYRGIKKAIDMDINKNLFDLMAGNQKKLELTRKNVYKKI